MHSSDAAAAGPRDLRGLARESITLALGGLAYKAVALLSVPVFARLLSPAQLGLLDVAVVVAGVMATVSALGIDHALARRYESEGADAVATAISVVAAASSFVAVLGVALSDPLATVLTGDAANQAVILTAALYAAILAVVTSLLNVLRVRHQAIRFAVVGFITVVMEMLFALAAALLFDRSIPAMVVGWTIGSLLGIVVLLATSKIRFGSATSGLALQMVRFGLPFVPAVLSWTLGDLVIRASIAQTLDLGAVGFFGIAARLTSALGLLVTGFGLAWHPYVYAQPESMVAAAAGRAAARLVAALAAAGILLAALAPELIEVVAGRDYVGGAVAVPGLAAGIIFLALITVGSAVAGRVYRTRTVAVACVVGAGLQAALAGPMTTALGLAGAATAAAIGYALAATVLLASLPGGRTSGLQRARHAAFTTGLGLAGLAVQLWLGHEAPLMLRLIVGIVSSAIVLAAGYASIARSR
jgi:O-antigen/teichoic acid export membrane protein